MKIRHLSLILSQFLYSFILFTILTIPAIAVGIEDVEKDVMCVCGCGKVLENCDCGVAENMRSEIYQMIERGMSKNEIIKELQATYGKEVLVNPPKEGVFLGLWYYPVFIIFIGLIILSILLKRKSEKFYADPDETINDDYELEQY